MSISYKLSKGTKAVSVILGALLTGFMWRARGTHGFGSFWGLVAVGTMVTLLIFAFYGNRKKMKFELMPIGALLMGATVPAWGEVVSMPGGIFKASYDSDILCNITQPRGACFMLMLGFGLICLYSVFVGTLFSEKEYKIKDYAVLVVVFFAAAAFAKATFAHYLLKCVSPELFNNFKDSLFTNGFELFPRQAYIHHFSDMAWAKHIPFGRPYYECIEHISYSFGAFALIFFSLIIFRDKLVALVSLAVNIFSAIAITVSDYFIICNYETSFISKIRIPSVLKCTSWSLWEFFTGLIIGASLFVIIALIPDKYTANQEYRSECYIQNNMLRYLFNIAGYLFVFYVVPFRAVALRLARNAVEYNYITNEDLTGIIFIVAASVIVFLCIRNKFKQNLYNRDLPVPFELKPSIFAEKKLTVLSIVYAVVYFFTGDALVIRFIYRIIKNPSAFKMLLTEGDMTSLPFMVCSFILFLVIYLVNRKQMKQSH